MAIEWILLNMENRSNILFCPSSISMEVARKFPLVNNSWDQQSYKLFNSFKSLEALNKFCSTQLSKTQIDNF